MAKTRVDVYTLIGLLHSVDSGRIGVPAFQRGLVWRRTDQLKLFASINLGYPIGIFTAVEGHDFDLLPSASLGLPSPSTNSADASRRLWLVDGVQRLATLYGGLRRGEGPNAVFYDLKSREFSHGINEKAQCTLRLSSLFDARALVSAHSRLAQQEEGKGLLRELNALHERFYSYQVPVQIIADIHRREVSEIFSRLNMSGLRLSKEEIARAMRASEDDE